SYGATRSANTAVRARSTISPADATPSGVRRSAAASPPSQPRLSATDCAGNAGGAAMAMGGPAIPDARIEPGVHEADRAAEAHQRCRYQHDVRLHHGIIAEEDSLHRQAPHPGQREDRLDDHGTGQQRSELTAHDGDDGDQRVLERVLVDDDAAFEALGPRR